MAIDRQSKISIGQWFFRNRDYTPIPLIILLLFFGKPTVASASLGLLCVVFGELIRIYSVSFIGGVSRTRSDSTGQSLVATGPFSMVRNPLYLGNFFISFGFSLFGGEAWIALLTVAMFAVQYFFIVQYEESILSQKFGDEYSNYRKRVPAFIPLNLPKLEQVEWPRDFSPALKSEKRTLTTIFALLAFLIALS
ncbi:methyltransferase family protein [Pseudobacteriovorax antillogorgiicola]|uniref:Phospholipid methyltransferase n=1 Tax=Pseudobacteriovorax antillogorgiicola TaxID=1513793 RepID=A0A1Y6B8P3_9BACT|nr:isoprenylcysteine carboxylmethyltransferase family protein [Pseudobacteriovorax antillogorgiicola]TCS58572.1 phospholipid methyltransferase [Pseudobacteriovorax antillogorgiicola]SME97370.1 Phospholipid methyltransferase [Pseudobacteriovorax antillogorgiicola]